MTNIPFKPLILSLSSPALLFFTVLSAHGNDMSEDLLASGNRAFGRNEYVSALQYYSRAIEQNPQDALMYSRRGKTRMNLKRLGDAREDFETSVRLDPDNPTSWHRLGIIQNELGELRPAIESFTRAIKLKPDYVHALNNRGMARIKAGDTELARQDLLRAVELDPHYDRAYTNLMYIDIRSGNYEEGLTYCLKAQESLKVRQNEKKPEGQLDPAFSQYVKPDAAMVRKNCAFLTRRTGSRFRLFLWIVDTMFKTFIPGGFDSPGGAS